MVLSEVMLCNTCYSLPRSPDSSNDSKNVLCSETLILISFSKIFLSYKMEAQNRLEKKIIILYKYRVNIEIVKDRNKWRRLEEEKTRNRERTNIKR